MTMFLRREKPNKLVEAAKLHLGYRAQVNRESYYGREANYRGEPWNGSFLNVVLQEAGMREVSTVSTISALAFYLKNRREVTKPRAGDIVFYSFATNRAKPFEQPHVGVISDASKWKSHGMLRVIEGETGTGSARGSQEIDGVFERERSKPDILAIVRPREYTRPEPETNTEGLPKLRPSYFASNPSTRTKATETLQTALSSATGMSGFTRGVYDQFTQSALDEFRRNRGMLGKTGKPDDTDLEVLNRATGKSIFRIEKGE